MGKRLLLDLGFPLKDDNTARPFRPRRAVQTGSEEHPLTYMFMLHAGAQTFFFSVDDCGS